MAPTVKTRAILFLLFISTTVAGKDENTPPECLTSGWSCSDKGEALKLKLIAIASILVASVVGVSLPLFSRSVPALKPQRSPFVVVKAFASGVILATGYMHVLPDAFACLTSPCLPEEPWRKFPFATFVAMLSAVATLMVDSFSTFYYRRRFPEAVDVAADDGEATKSVGPGMVGHLHGRSVEEAVKENGSELIRHRVVAQVSAITFI